MRCFRMLIGLTAAVTLLIFCACLPKVAVVESEPGDELFARAENHYNQGLYNSALNLYQEYLYIYPEGKAVPAALLRVGDVFFVRGEYANARRQYGRVIEKVSESRFAEDAMIGILLSWYNEEQYDRVIGYADAINDEKVSDGCVARKYVIISDAYLAMEETVDAAYVLIAALRKVDESQQKRILTKLDQISGRIGAETLQTLLADVRDPVFRGYLSCQIGNRYMQKEDYERAVNVLSDFIAAYPDKAYAGKAREMLRQIEKAAVYDRYAIGCLLPLTGEYRLFGERALKGIQFAFQEFVSTHSREGESPRIRLIIGDTGSNQEQAVAAVKELADKKVAAIIGPLGSFKDAIQEAENRHIPIVTLCQEQNIPAIGKYVFRNFMTPQMQVESLARYACHALGLRKFAVLYPDEDYGRVFAHKFWDEILKYGGEIVGFESYDPAETDFAESIKKLAGIYYPVPPDLKEARERRLVKLGLKRDEAVAPVFSDENIEIMGTGGQENGDRSENKVGEAEEEAAEEEETALVDFEALFIPDGPSKAGLIVPQLVFHDVVDTLLLGTHLWHSQELIETAGLYAQGAVLPADFWEPGAPSAGHSFSLRYENFYNEKPGFISAVAYDTAAILMNVINDPSVRYRYSIIDRLGEMADYPGVTGRTAFDKSGEVRKALTLIRIRGRRFEEIAKTLGGFLNDPETPPGG